MPGMLQVNVPKSSGADPSNLYCTGWKFSVSTAKQTSIVPYEKRVCMPPLPSCNYLYLQCLENRNTAQICGNKWAMLSSVICMWKAKYGVKAATYEELLWQTSFRCSSNGIKLFLVQVPAFWITHSTVSIGHLHPWSAMWKCMRDQWIVVRCHRDKFSTHRQCTHAYTYLHMMMFLLWWIFCSWTAGRYPAPANIHTLIHVTWTHVKLRSIVDYYGILSVRVWRDVATLVIVGTSFI